MQNGRSRGTVLYDSGSVAAGALITAQDPRGKPLDLGSYESILVIVDNTAGSVFRDLSLVSYLDDGTTQIDSVLLRKVAFGAAPTGSSYAPGAVRGTIGPGAAAGPSGVHVLYDATGAADAAVASGKLAVEDIDAIHARASCSAGTTVLSAIETDDAGGAVTILANAAAANALVNWGPGLSLAGVINAMMPRTVEIRATTPGAGNTVRVRVIGRGRPPGTFAMQMALPARAKLTLAAAGAAAARMTIIGR